MEQLHSCLRPVLLWFFAALSASPVLAQITFVKTIGTNAPSNNGTSTTIPIPTSGVGAGHSIILSFALNPGTGAVSCTDTRGNSYTVNRDVTNGSGNSGVRTVILSAHNVVALTGGNTISCAHPRVSARALSASEFAGLATSAPVDQVQSTTGAGTAPSSGLTPPTSQQSELLIGAIGVEGPITDTFSPGFGYMSIGRGGTSGGNAANNITVNPEYRIVNATAAYAANGTLSVNRLWAAAIVTYKAALPTKLVITSVNGGSNITAGNYFSVVVQSQTESGIPANVLSSTVISLSRKSGTGILDGTLSGTIPAGANQVTLTDVTYTKAESGVILTASRTSGDVLTAGDSAGFTVNPGSATKLAFTTHPANATAGSTIGGPPTLFVQDSFGNTVTNSTATVVIAIGANPGGGTLAGTRTQDAVGGIVAFTNLTINKAGSGYTLTASAAGLTAATSNSFNISAGAAAALAFTIQPGNATAGNNLSGPPTVAVQDGFGNTVTSSVASITIGIGANPGGATLSGTTTKSAVAGIASFNNLSINAAGSGYTLVASSSGLTSATSSSFNVTAAGFSLVATPTAVAAGNPFTVTWAQIPNPSNRDWIGIYRDGSSDSSYSAYIYVSCSQSPNVPVITGSCSFPIPASIVPGIYEFRLFSNNTYNRLATSNDVIIAPPTSQNMLTIGLNATVTAGTPGFFVTVLTQTPSGTPVNVSNDTGVVLSLTTGSGIFAGTLNGTILAGTNQTTIGPATYSKAESGVVINASYTSGDQVAPGTSFPFTVIPGPPAVLAFIIQPGNATVGSTIPGPPTIIVQDNAGNTLSPPTAPISIAFGANPGGGSLDNDIQLIFGSTIAFPSLSINQVGNGYTLVASAAGLVSATSNPFNITSAAGGGTISGIITRVSNGATIAGAMVEAYQSDTLRGAGITSSSGSYSIPGLATGSYTVRASFTGLVPQMVNNVPVISGSTTPVDLSLNFGIAVQSPVAGATINDLSVLVTGNFDTSLAPEVGIKVNGNVALIDGNEFTTIVPIDSQTTTLTATMTDTAGNFLAGDLVPITPQPPNNEPVLSFRPSPAIALVTQPVSFSLTSLNEFSQVQLDGNGDGTIDFAGTTLEGLSVTFAEPGLYYPNIRVTEVGGFVRTATSVVQILNMVQLDALLQSKWNAMKDALRTGNTAAAANYIVNAKRAVYQNVFNNLLIPFANIDQILGNITYVAQRGINVEYKFIRIDGGIQVTYMVLFGLDEDGVWRIRFF